MKIKKLSLTLISACSVLLAGSTDENLIDLEKRGEWIALPYAFTSDATGLSGGVGAIAQGILQPQTTLVASVFMGTEQDIVINGNDDTGNFSGAFISLSNLKIPYTKRMYFSFWGLNKSTPLGIYYLDGSNDSNPDHALVSSGTANYFYSTLSYVLPIGEGTDNPDGKYKLKNGFAMDREEYGNGTPFETGRTTVGVKAFFQEQDFENWDTSLPWGDYISKPEWNTSGLKFFLSHKNVDFDLNPSRGYSFQLQYSKDWGDDLQSWDFLEFEFNKYYTLNTLPYTQQNVLALNLWTGYSFSWDTESEVIPGIAAHRPPLDEGSRLGGFFRMRAYDANRFSDKAVLYGTAEYRAIIDYNPFKSTELKDYTPIAIDWFQVVAFVEAGRVNDEYNLDLLKDMKYDVGLSLRAMAAELPVRFDIAYGDEGTSMWVMIKHPFDFFN